MAGASRQTAPYVADLDRLAKILSRGEIMLVRSVVTHTQADVPIAATERFPVVLFSPGAGNISALYTSLLEDLASHGYVVAAIDHTYEVKGVVLGDGRLVTEAKRPSGGEALLRDERARVTVRTEDMRFVLDQLTRIDAGLDADSWRGRLDLSRVAAFGHSIGGMTAAELCMRELRVLACANLDGVVAAVPAYLGADGQGPVQPFLFMEKPLRGVKGETPAETQRRVAFLRGRGNAALASVRRGRSYRVTIDDATHASFSDEEWLQQNSARHQELIVLVRQYLRAFLDQTLSDARDTVLDVPPADSAVHIQAFTPR
jgi:dienelactone hydrolase